MTLVAYASTDASAPTLSGTAGDLINLLDKCLVSGYGSKAAAGWTKPYTATNAATFRPGSGLQHYFHFDDNASNATDLAKTACFRGSIAASGFQSGITEYFPTTTQFGLTSGLFARKSTTADATTRAWKVFADDRTAYVLVLTGDNAGTYFSFAFGEMYSLLPGTDSYRSFVIGNTATGGANNTGQFAGQNGATALIGHYMPRNYSAAGTAIQYGKTFNTAKCGSGSSVVPQGTCLSGADPSSAAILISPWYMIEPTNFGLRGRLRGMFQLCHTLATFTDGDTIAGAGAYTGRTFVVAKTFVGGTSFNGGPLAFDITGPWETN